MVLKLSTEIKGAGNVSALFKSIDTGLKNFKEPLREIDLYMNNEIQKNFSTEGSTFKRKWEPLNPDYAKQKKRKFGNKKILEASGKMKNAFTSKLFSTRLEITNNTEYFKYHQSSRSRKGNLPRRVMMAITNTQQAEIFRAFTKYINKITKNS